MRRQPVLIALLLAAAVTARAEIISADIVGKWITGTSQRGVANWFTFRADHSWRLALLLGVVGPIVALNWWRLKLYFQTVMRHPWSALVLCFPILIITIFMPCVVLAKFASWASGSNPIVPAICELSWLIPTLAFAYRYGKTNRQKR
jgi:hypothetical protein